jgi:pimeloyl-ACP methyl ester carboxylesterase
MVRRQFITGALGAAIIGGLPSSAGADASTAAARFHGARRWADTEFGRISYVEQGAGAVAIFLHGWPLNGFHWRGSLERLSPLRRSIAPDFLGLGYTDTPEGVDLSPTTQAAMIIAFMDALSIEHADFVANDSGTAIAQIIAALHPERVRTMLLTNGDVHTNSPPEALAPAIAAARAGLLADMITRHLEEPGFAASSMGLGGICYTDPANLTSEAMEVYFRPLLATPLSRTQFQAYGVAFEPNPLPALEGRLRRCAIPTRMLWGTGDVHFASEWAAWLDDVLPESRGVRFIDGAKLFFPEEYPDVVAE